MGYKAWREKQNARIDAMIARTDGWAERAKEREARVKADVEQAQAERTRVAQQAQDDQQLELYRSTAASMGFDHDEVAERAAAVGIGLPRLWKPSGRLLMTAGVLNALSLGGSSARDLDASGSRYRMWVVRVVEEERARGVDLPYPRR